MDACETIRSLAVPLKHKIELIKLFNKMNRLSVKADTQLFDSLLDDALSQRPNSFTHLQKMGYSHRQIKEELFNKLTK